MPDRHDRRCRSWCSDDPPGVLRPVSPLAESASGPERLCRHPRPGRTCVGWGPAHRPPSGRESGRRGPGRWRRSALLASFCGLGHVVGAGSHDEVVAMQALDGVAPPGHGDFAPFGQQAWVMAFGFGYFTDGVGEGQGVLEVLEQENFFQLHDAVANFDVPVRDLLDKDRQLFVADLRGAGLAGFAVGLIQSGHGLFPDSILVRRYYFLQRAATIGALRPPWVLAEIWGRASPAPCLS